MIIIINPHAAAGKALDKWKKIEGSVQQKFSPGRVIIMNKEKLMNRYISECIEQGHFHFVAAGGDGTINTLLQTVLKASSPAQLKQVKIGAVGLGSSNDFHKPFTRDSFIKRIPCLLNFESSEKRDVGILNYLDADGLEQKKYWLINASVGITAQANYFFNHPDIVLRNLKKSFTQSAILYAALRTIFFYKNKNVHLRYAHNKNNTINLTNMGVIKNPHFAGNFAYDNPFCKDDGQFFVNISRDMRLLNIFNLLLNLSRHRFSGLDKTETRHTSYIKVTAATPFAVEYDGEVISTKKASFKINKKGIGVCSC